MKAISLTSARPGPRLVPALLLTLALALGRTNAAEVYQYRGPQGDGIASMALAKAWPKTGPRTLWKVPTPAGFSSFGVGGGRVFTLVKRSLEGADREVCVALEASSGKELWAAPVGIGKYDGGGDSGKAPNTGGDGPRSTPVVAGDRVFTLSGQLVLTCLEAATGKAVWTRDLVKAHGGKNIRWQNAASPVVDGDRLFVAAGGAGQSLLAFRLADGQVLWKGQDDQITHATPVVATLEGVRQVIFFTQQGLVSLSTDRGELLWRQPFPFNISTAASPVVDGDLVYCSAGYDVGSTALKISKKDNKFSVQELWRLKGNRPVANHWSTPVLYQGHLYGMFSYKQYGDGPMKCVELATGKVLWEQPGFGAGNVMLAGENLVALSDAGELVLVKADPAAYRELARAKVVDGKCWSTPALADGRAYVRSTTEGACLDLSDAVAQR